MLSAPASKTERLSAKLARREEYGGVFRHAHWCPACSEMHSYSVEQAQPNGARWTWDGNAEAPTFTPSMNRTVGPMRDGRIERCHYFVTAGKIAYCGDSTHAMAGQTVDLPDIPDQVWLRAGAALT